MLRDLARGRFFSLLGLQNAENLIGQLYDFSRIQQSTDPVMLKQMILDGVKELEVLPDTYRMMDLRTSAIVLATALLDSSEVEAQDCEPGARQGSRRAEDNRVAHRARVKRVGMADGSHGTRRALPLIRGELEPRFQGAGRTVQCEVHRAGV